MNGDGIASIAPQTGRRYRIVDLNYITFYVEEFQAAIDFYSQAFGAPDSIGERERVVGWRMGATWLTIFPGKGGPGDGGNPRNTEFAIQVSSAEEVDELYDTLIAAGAASCMRPHDTSMYEPMRFACVDDPFGVRIDVYAPRSASS